MKMIDGVPYTAKMVKNYLYAVQRYLYGEDIGSPRNARFAAGLDFVLNYLDDALKDIELQECKYTNEIKEYTYVS